MSIDVQRYRDASMSYMGLCDAFLFTPGWRILALHSDRLRHGGETQ